MKNLVFPALVLSALGTFAIGQTTKGANTSPATVQGCLDHSSSGYTLTDTSGATYQLRGDTAELNEYVGNEVQISGKTALAAEASGAPSVVTKEIASEIDVSEVKQISSNCKPKPDSQKPPMSSVPQG